ncbi:MAG: flagellar assembly protein FliW [Phycisphaeraceae bacterium]
MQIDTTRFGPQEVDETRIITFPKGILGFASFQRYVLMEAGEESYFWWLQSVDAPDLAFVVTDPSLFVPTYKVPLRADQMAELGMGSIDDAQVFVIVNKREQLLTGNLQGPLVVHVRDRIAEQLVLSDRRFTTRVPLIELNQAQAHAESRAHAAAPAVARSA